jgi:6-phosphofructokinase 1
MSGQDAMDFAAVEKRRKAAATEPDREHVKAELAAFEARHQGNTMRLAKQLEELTHLEARVTILGYVQRGGTPSVADRLLATRLGTACAGFIHEGVFGVMVAARGDGVKAVPIEEVAGRLKTVPAGHQWIEAARRVGTCMGD